MESGEYECIYYTNSPRNALKGGIGLFGVIDRCRVKVTPKTLKITLLEPCRATSGVEQMAFKNGAVSINLEPRKTKHGMVFSPHSVLVWDDGDFTVYFYREGIPTYFRRIKTTP